eukprot:COSAG01_NODE_16637_length_1218_cov_5.727435_1_plen_278_part_00
MTTVTTEQKDKMTQLFELAMGENPPDPELDALGRMRPGERTESETEKLQKQLTDWMRTMQVEALKAFDAATEMDEKAKAKQKKEREKQSHLKKWSMSQETLNEYDEREKELLKLEQRWRAKILAAESRKRRKYITKEWRRQNTALRKAWAKRICKAAKNDYRRWLPPAAGAATAATAAAAAAAATTATTTPAAAGSGGRDSADSIGERTKAAATTATAAATTTAAATERMAGRAAGATTQRRQRIHTRGSRITCCMESVESRRTQTRGEDGDSMQTC